MGDNDDDVFFVECGNEDEPDEDVPNAGEDTESDNEEEADSLQMVFAYQSTITKLRKINSNNGPNHFATTTVAAMSKLAVKLMERLFSTENDDCVEQPEQQEEPSASTSQQVQRSLAEQLTLALKASREVTNKQAGKVIDYKKEMQMYAKIKVRSPTLDRLFEGLKTIQATSVAAERCFSEANILVNKVRNCLCDENIDAISFLKCYFRNKLIK